MTTLKIKHICHDSRALDLRLGTNDTEDKFLASDFIEEHNTRHTSQIQISVLAIVSVLAILFVSRFYIRKAIP